MMQSALRARQGEVQGLAHRWFWVFCLMSVWVYSIRSSAFLLVWSDLAAAFEPVGYCEYPVQVLGACLLPWLLDRVGWTNRPSGNRNAFIAFGVGSLALMGAMPFVPGFAVPLILFYLLQLLASAMMGMALRRGAMLWRADRAALYMGGAYTAYHVAATAHHYAFFATNNPLFYLAAAFTLFGGLIMLALVVRLKTRDDFTTSEPPAPEVPFPRPFLRAVVWLLALHALFSVLVNTVWYFDNMDDFHTPGYELFFYALALLVMAFGTWLLHKRRWFSTTMACLLVLCLGQGLTLWGIENRPLAISYNLLTMATKMPPYLLSLSVPVWYAAATRRPSLACLGFGINTGVEFLIMLTQLRPGTLGVIPRQGALLLLGLGLVALLVWVYLKYQRIQTDALLSGIRAGHAEHKTPEQTLEALSLTPREQEVALLLLKGDSQKIIAAKLRISGATVGFHVKNLYRKLNIQSRSELFALFLTPVPGGLSDGVGI